MSSSSRPNKRLLEVCCGDIASVRAAAEAGAHRIELCSALSLDGLTPSYGTIGEALLHGLTTHVLIRPRTGDFVYTPDEIAIMVADIEMCGIMGVHGVVIGALSPDGRIDTKACRQLIDAAGDMHITFHRAFDAVADQIRALEDIARLGCHYLLTSGGQPTAQQGQQQLRRLHQQTAGRLQLIAASGVTPDNAAAILDTTGITQIHGSLRAGGPSSDLATIRRTLAAMTSL